MHLYNLTLKRADASLQAVVGSFSGARQSEILVSRGRTLELLHVNAQTGKLSRVVSADVFASIRTLEKVRLPGNTKDCVAVGSDSGCLVVLEFSKTTGSFIRPHQETFGKSGARRIVPGQFLAADPKGRSILIAAIESSKLVYTLSRDATTNITISSPLEANSPGTIMHDVVGLDVGFDNPMFAVLEVSYRDSDCNPTGNAAKNAMKMLTFYELDLGLNHVVRKWSGCTHRSANLLVRVPGGTGPSGVLVCCEDHIIYQHMSTVSHRVPIPRCTQSSDRGLLIVAAATHEMNEFGDLYKVTLDHSDGIVHALKIKYFDTIPVSSSICILKTGFLFAASEFGNQCLYHFQSLAEDDEETEHSSIKYLSLCTADKEPFPRVLFRPRSLRNLMVADEIVALNPIIQTKILNSATPNKSLEILAACGRGSRSTLRVLQHGLAVDNIIKCDLPSSPNGLWATKRLEIDENDVFIIFSFTNATLVFSIGEVLVEVHDSGFLSSVNTLAVQQLGADSLVQVHSGGIRHILATAEVREWVVPPGTNIAIAATNKRQIVIALSSAEIVYFELDLDGQLNEYQEHKATGTRILTVGLAEVPEGRQRTPYLAVGCEDQTVRIFSLDPEQTLANLSIQALISPPSSICIIEVPGTTESVHHVHIGLQNGVLLRTVLDARTGQLGDSLSRFVGSRSVQLSYVKVWGAAAMLILSSRAWISRTENNQTHFTPLLCDELRHGCSFSHAISSEGFAGVFGNEFRIFHLSKVKEELHQRSIPLTHTPRRMAVHPKNGYVYLAEGDHRVESDMLVEGERKPHEESSRPYDGDQQMFNRPSASAGSWSSCIRIVDPVKEKTVAVVVLPKNEAAFCIAIVPFAVLDGELLVVVGTATGVVVEPRSCTSGYIRTYRLTDSGDLELYHLTEVGDVPLAICAFQGRLLAGIGKALRIYDLGKQKLLRKAEKSSFAFTIVTLDTQGSRIIVGDMQDSLTFIVYNPAEQRLVVVADDTQPRWTTCSTMVDYNTIAGGDRFGNVFVNRLDSIISDRVDKDVAGSNVLREKGQLNGAPHKTQMVAHFHVGDLITSMHKVSLVSGSREVILYTGLHGTIGLLVPLASQADIDFFSSLEQHMRKETTSLVGRDHLSWRGYYAPVKAVVDGDLCELFSNLPRETQRLISVDLNRTAEEVAKKVEQLRILSSGF
ncbi:CPSF A subunit region-domain-containing protein [Mycena crocata]|nr:CPSF A subunit region-domain-containing protein [Mycena crocata]